MRKINLLFLTFLFTMHCLSGAYCQDTISQPDPEAEDYAQQTRDLVSYFEGTLNFLGDPSATVQEKEIVINESYIKMFKDDKVQVEDDLDEYRQTNINKDVQAYLKDVDFFFTEARFTFDIQKVEQLVNSNNEIYFKVSLMRKLDAKTIENKTVENSHQRFIEINLNPIQKELKIVSYYTTKINEREELASWWGNMATEWKEFFGANIMVNDTLPITKVIGLTDDAIIVNRMHRLIRNDSFMVVNQDTLLLSEIGILHGHRPDTILYLNDTSGVLMPDTLLTDVSEIYSKLKGFTQLKEVNISYKFQFFDLEPLSELTDLKLIDFSNTVIGDLSPLRNLNQLDAIYFSNTQVSDLTPLQYSVNIKEIHCFNTPVEDIRILSGFKQLEKLYCFNSKITSLAPVSEMKTLQSLRASNTRITDVNALSDLTFLLILDISNTSVSDIGPLKNLGNVEVLNLDNTLISSLEAVRNMKELKTIQFNNTNIGNLDDLTGLPLIQKVYCERTGVTSAIATAFTRIKPGCLVIYETEELTNWWKGLPIYWKAILSEQSKISASPNPEELHEVIILNKLDLSGNRYLQNLDPVGRLINLNTLLLSKTEITDLAPIATLSELTTLDISNTRVANIIDLSSLHNLATLNIENTRIDNLDALGGLTQLRLILADGSRLNQQTVTTLLAKQPDVKVIFQSEVLRAWWNNMTQDWKDVFRNVISLDINPNAIQLQAIADLKKLELTDNLAINSIVPISRLLLLEELYIKGTMVNDLSPISDLKYLKKLEIPGNPVADLQPIANVLTLGLLNIENTPISDLSPVESLINLKILNIGGTHIKSLKPIASLTKLEELSINNTDIKSLSPADILPNLKQLKCFETKIKSKQINQLRTTRPGLKIYY